MNSDEYTDSEASSSPSPPASPAASIHTTPPTLERLIQHFASAKRSLSSTNHVWRANELVTNSRALIEEIAVLNARNTYTGREVGEGLEVLCDIKEGIVVGADDAGDEFSSTIEKLDRANERLERTLRRLKETIVDVSLQQRASLGDVEEENGQSIADNQSSASLSQSKDGAGGGEDRTLYSFIDTTAHQNLQSSLRKDIDTYNDARKDMDSTISTFSDSLKTIADLLSDTPSGPAEKRTLYDEPPPTISALFHGMEDHAAEMAGLLGSLVRHYDLCVTALKHTEGGSEAAKRAIQGTDLSRNGEAAGGGGAMEESLNLKSAPSPISDEEKEEMLRVLETDAAEVEDVVAEVRERNREQESLFEQLTQHARKARTRDGKLREVVEMLHEMRSLHLPAHLHALQTFRSSWSRIQDSITSKTSSLLGLAASNESFLAAYTQLLREVDRRKAAETQMRRVAAKANKEITRLFEADREARRDFMEEFGPFLPRGIWAGAGEEGRLWEVREVGTG